MGSYAVAQARRFVVLVVGEVGSEKTDLRKTAKGVEQQLVPSLGRTDDVIAERDEEVGRRQRERAREAVLADVFVVVDDSEPRIAN